MRPCTTSTCCPTPPPFTWHPSCPCVKLFAAPLVPCRPPQPPTSPQCDPTARRATAFRCPATPPAQSLPRRRNRRNSHTPSLRSRRCTRRPAGAVATPPAPVRLDPGSTLPALASARPAPCLNPARIGQASTLPQLASARPAPCLRSLRSALHPASARLGPPLLQLASHQ